VKGWQAERETEEGAEADRRGCEGLGRLGDEGGAGRAQT
jgi:hypothetical protein